MKVTRWLRESPWRMAGILAMSGAVVISGAAVAYASIPDGSGVIHACYKTSVPTHGTPLSIINSATGSCAADSTALTWNQTGPQGPQGATGPAGATGPQGPAGPPAGAGQQILSVTGGWGTGRSPGSVGSVSLYCPTGFVATGGGYQLSGADTSTTVQEKYIPFIDEPINTPGVPSGWLVELIMTGTPDPGADDYSLKVFAICSPAS